MLEVARTMTFGASALVVPSVALVLLIWGCGARQQHTSNEAESDARTQPGAADSAAPLPSSPEEVALRHSEEDRLWATRTGFSDAQVRQLRHLADISDDVAEFIVNIDTESLRRQGNILFVSAGGNGHCLQIDVFRAELPSFDRVWSAESFPDGSGFCREAPQNPRAYVGPDADIFVDIPVFDYNTNSARGLRRAVYRWNGHSYYFVGATLVDDQDG
jgi:hypothetical protein